MKGIFCDTKWTTKYSIRTQKVTNISTMISQLEPSAPQEILLVSKMPTNVSILSSTIARVTSEIWIQRKKGIWSHQQCCLQEMIQFQIKIVQESSTDRIQSFNHFYPTNLLDINYLLMVSIFQILQKKNIIILQIIHVLIMNIAWGEINVDKCEDKDDEYRDDNSEVP